jgi:putative endonuclease
VDIVAYDGPTLVFVEVKTRETEDFGPPDRAVDRDKRAHILRAAGDYLRRSEVPWNRCRFDIVNVVFGGKITIRHMPDAFRPGSPV